MKETIGSCEYMLDKKEIEKIILKRYNDAGIKVKKIRWNLEIKHEGDQREPIEYAVLKGLTATN